MKARDIAFAGIVGCASCAGDLRPGPMSVPVQDLSAQRDKLLGTTIVTQGCLSDSGEHGAYIGPCDDATGSKITLVTDPGNRINRLFFKTLGHLGGELEVRVTGLLVQIDSQRLGRPVIRLEIQSIALLQGRQP